MSFFQPAPGTVLSHDIADYPDGVVLPIDKPYRWTSADVIRKVKFAAFRHFRKKNLKVGHAGTLDPLATGVLLVCLGPACKRAQEFQDHDKEYVASVRFGATTPSYDLEKEVDRTFPYDQVTEEAVRAVLPSFLGPQEQVAPLFSAKSVDGVRAYEMARKLYRNAQKGIQDPDFDAAALETLHRSRITISELELLGFVDAFDAREASAETPRTKIFSPEKRSKKFCPTSDADAACTQTVISSDAAGGVEKSASSRINVADTSSLGLPEAKIRIACSKGTYIRAFARDLGEALGTGAHLSGLVRTKTGAFRLEDALSLEEALALLAD
jgi:tRNA pseudouridine55 synthase